MKENIMKLRSLIKKNEISSIIIIIKNKMIGKKL
jgi:hypothetical protein